MADELPSLTLSAQPFTCRFLTPTLLSCGLITGHCELHTVSPRRDASGLHPTSDMSDGLTLLKRLRVFTSAVRRIVPGPAPNTFIACSSHGQVATVDYADLSSPSISTFTASPPASGLPVGLSALSLPPSLPSLLVTGSDSGAIRVYPVSAQSSAVSSTPLYTSTVHSDYVSSFVFKGTACVALGGDGRISCHELSKVGQEGKDPFVRVSDEQDDEFLAGACIKGGAKLVLGTQSGVLSVFGWGKWGDIETRFPGHPESVDALVKVDENTVLTGSSDGMLRVSQVQPDKFLGVFGDHGGFPVEGLEWGEGGVIASWSHDDV
eukprot:CAMPEP_0182469914 /NCGR_PEP_ID=MMETSP1319-20130603/17835_1 /TAXON_ID=172717 /ORGANISM="Bolidomonas pacifica, Strain RCC208" /LENGTH=320 /DNA_ID=CAMNT_0024670283 /DNA_START=129 /DNA_END=1087 /DNA_ORIENTATION=-